MWLLRALVFSLSIILLSGADTISIAGDKPQKHKQRVPKKRPMYNSIAPKPVFDDKPINPKKPKKQSSTSYKKTNQKKPMYNNKPTYKKKPVHNNKPTYKKKPVHNNKPTYKKKPVHKKKKIIYQNNYKKQSTYPPKKKPVKKPIKRKIK